MRKKQEEIIYRIASEHGISKTHSKEIWKLFTNKIAETISDQDKKEDGKFSRDKFKVVHISNFGKFIPNYKKIYFANKCLKAKKNED